MSRGDSTYAATLDDLLRGLVTGPYEGGLTVSGMCQDSRQCTPGALFIACAGQRHHGLEFIADAMQHGAIAAVFEPSPSMTSKIADLASRYQRPFIAVPELSRLAGVIAARFYQHPSAQMQVIGVTGTNGKTSCTHFIAQAMERQQIPAGVIGTLGYGRYRQLRPASHTTPDALTLQCELAALRDQGVESVAMEVSSHALEQGRVSGVQFTGAVLTNLSHDHLDYHGDLASYGRAKQKLFMLPGLSFAVINSDDEFGRSVAAALPETARCLRYGLDYDQDRPPEVRGTITALDRAGMRMQVHTPWGDGMLHSALLGEFNASNLLAVLCVLLLSGQTLEQALANLAQVDAVPGRMEHFGGLGRLPLVVVDYAHTPDALQQVLRSLRRHCSGRLWCVFGCGGDRDRSKRPLMGAIAAQYADQVIVTDDNPRTEDGAAIIRQISAGMPSGYHPQVIRNRDQAIAAAVMAAAAGDVVLVAGKGHEDYQIIGDRRTSFSDREHVRRVLQEVA